MEKVTIGIIGIGPRGLSVIERINEITSSMANDTRIDLHLIDPNEYGQGSHYAAQPDYLLVNTVASQITMFGDHTVTDAGPVNTGLSMHEWAKMSGYREINGNFYCVGSEVGNEIDENAYLPRKMLGEYLSWVFDGHMRSMPEQVNVVHHKHKATDIIPLADKLEIALENGHRIVTDYLFVTTGHGQNVPSTQDFEYTRFVQAEAAKNTQLNYFRNPYPLDKLTQISRNARVAIQGIGLTTYDVISQLTEGRGGRFSHRDGELVYLPSGREPHISLYSRQSLPFCSRAENEKGVSGQYSARFLTMQAIDALRARTDNPSGQLDFELDILPLLVTEMCYVYRCTLNAAQFGCEISWLDESSYTPSKEDRAKILSLFFPLQDKRFASLDEFRQFVLNYLQLDYQQACEGNVSNPVKAATDVIRDVRDNLRHAVDFCGLTPESHAKFLNFYCPIMNRLAVGPPKQRNQELMALIAAGVVSIGAGPSPAVKCDAQHGEFKLVSEFDGKEQETRFDVLVKAKIDSFFPVLDDSILMRNLLNRGLIRPCLNGHQNVGGIDITATHHPIDKNGTPLNNIWALGNLVEGANFYTYVLARPMVNSRLVRDAGKCVLSMFEQLSEDVLSPHSLLPEEAV